MHNNVSFVNFFADCMCVYVCLFVRISVDTTVIIKKCHCLYKRLQICEFPSLPKMKTTLAIRVFVKKRTTKKILLPYYEHKIKQLVLLWFQHNFNIPTHTILLLKLPICTRYLLANPLHWLQCLQIILFKKVMSYNFITLKTWMLK